MMDAIDVAWFQLRRAEELERLEPATSLGSAAAHRGLAAQYLALINCLTAAMEAENGKITQPA